MSDSNAIRVRLQRGASQIGGVCTEVFTDQTRIFFDFGSPLEGEGNQEKLNIEGLTQGTVNTDAVFLTHYHGDHVGEIPRIMAGIPVYMHRTARRILQAQQEHKVSIGQIVWAKHNHSDFYRYVPQTFYADTIRFGLKFIFSSI